MNLTQRLRLSMLPLSDIDKALPNKGLIYEIGCGSGAISLYISKTKSRRVVGIDTNKKKIKIAAESNGNKNLLFEIGNADSFRYEPCNGFILSDFLHHVPFSTQTSILKKVTKVLKKGGILIIKEIDSNDSLRTIMSRIWDYILYPEDTIYYRDKQSLKLMIHNLGYEVQVTRKVWWFPGSTYLYLCTKN